MGKRIYCGNLSFQTTQDEVRSLFAAHGEVTDVHMVMDRETGRPRGFAFVEMASDDDAQKAINDLIAREFGGRNLTVNEARPKAAHGGGGGGRGGFGGGGGSRRRSEPRW